MRRLARETAQSVSRVASRRVADGRRHGVLGLGRERVQNFRAACTAAPRSDSYSFSIVDLAGREADVTHPAVGRTAVASRNGLAEDVHAGARLATVRMREVWSRGAQKPRPSSLW